MGTRETMIQTTIAEVINLLDGLKERVMGEDFLKELNTNKSFEINEAASANGTNQKLNININIKIDNHE